MLEIYVFQKYIKWMSENCSYVSRNVCLLKNKCMYFQKQKTTKFGLQILGHSFSTYAKFSEKFTFLTP